MATEGDLYRDYLLYFRKGPLRPEEGKFRIRSVADCLDLPRENPVRIGIDIDINRTAALNVSEIRFSDIRPDLHRIFDDDFEKRLAYLHDISNVSSSPD